MKKIVLLAFVLVLLSTALSLCVVGLLELKIVFASPYTDIDVDTAYNMITNASYPDLVVLDVRTQTTEYDSGHIYGAVFIPQVVLEERINALAGHENHEIIVYSKSGVRSVTASEILDSHNFTKVYNMRGGIQAWQSAGYPVWITYRQWTLLLEFKFEVPSKVQVNQTFEVEITVTNKANETIDLFWTFIELQHETIYLTPLPEDFRYPPSYPSESVIFQKSYTFTKENFSYSEPVIPVCIYWNSRTWKYAPQEQRDSGLTDFVIYIETDYWETRYNTLQDDFEELTSDYNSLQQELSTLRKLLYVFLATTITLTGITIYVAIRKPKVKTT